MLPKWHILLGLLFSLILYFFLDVNFFNSLIVFLASVLIDFDHYMLFVKRKKDWNLKRAYKWNIDILKNHKPIMYFFHTIEFLIFVFLLSYFFNLFLFVFIGMLFHSFSDIVEMNYLKALNLREFSLIRHLLTKDKKISIFDYTNLYKN